MTKLNWDKLAKRPRDPGWANERVEKTTLVSSPSSRFARRRRRQLGSASTTAVTPSRTTLWRLANQALRAKPRKKHKRTNTTGATLPFDRYSLAAETAKQEKAAKKAERKARKKQRRAQRPAQPLKLASRAKPAPIPGAPTGQKTTPSRLKVDLTQVSKDSIAASWAAHPSVYRWKVTCLDRGGQQVRKSGLAAEVCEVKIGRLETAQQPLRLLVRGHSRDGQLVCEGAIDALRLV